MNRHLRASALCSQLDLILTSQKREQLQNYASFSSPCLQLIVSHLLKVVDSTVQYVGFHSLVFAGSQGPGCISKFCVTNLMHFCYRAATRNLAFPFASHFLISLLPPFLPSCFCSFKVICHRFYFEDSTACVCLGVSGELLQSITKSVKCLQRG